jgi:uncharacterized protein
MSEIRFEWDQKKNALNKRKHRVAFEEGQTVFADEHALLLDDPDRSEEEDRFVLLGLSSKLHLLVVCHTYRKDDRVVRIISSRKAASSEQKQYWNRW